MEENLKLPNFLREPSDLIDAEAVSAIKQWLRPINKRHRPDFERLTNNKEFKSFWFDLKQVFTRSHLNPTEHLIGNWLCETFKIIVYRGGQLPRVNPGELRKARATLIKSVRNHLLKGRIKKAREVLRKDHLMSSTTLHFLRNAGAGIYRHPPEGVQQRIIDLPPDSLLIALDLLQDRIAKRLDIHFIQRLEEGPVRSPRVGQQHAQALMLERALLDFFRFMTGIAQEKLLERARILAFGEDPFATTGSNASQRNLWAKPLKIPKNPDE